MNRRSFLAGIPALLTSAKLGKVKASQQNVTGPLAVLMFEVQTDETGFGVGGQFIGYGSIVVSPPWLVVGAAPPFKDKATISIANNSTPEDLIFVVNNGGPNALYRGYVTVQSAFYTGGTT